MRKRSFLTTSGLCWFVLMLVLSACTPTISTPTSIEATPIAAITPTLASVEAAVVFSVRLAEGVVGGALYLDVVNDLDDVYRPPQRFKLEKQADDSYAAGISAAPGEVVRYRFSRGENNAEVETTCAGQTTNLRAFLVSGEDISLNVVCGWGEPVYKGGLGRISGVVSDANSGDPISGALVMAAGQRTITSADGSYLIEGLPPGTHNLYASVPDGSFAPFQQGAVVAAESNTPAPLEMNPVRFVDVTFRVAAPPSALPSLPIRLIGNAYGLGNSLAGLAGGLALDAAQAPLLSQQNDGNYALTLKLPVGFDLRYRYTLGDGLWNSERDTDGAIYSRHLIVPAKNVTIEEEIAAWQIAGLAPVTFQLGVPGELSTDESVAIQFAREGTWTQPVNMWPLGGGNWYFILYAPVETGEELRYRYCRNGLCDNSGNAQSAGTKALGVKVAFKEDAQMIGDTASGWTDDLPRAIALEEPVEVPAKHRKGLFFSGVELQPGAVAGWQEQLPAALNDIEAIHAGWVTLTPEWHYSSQNPPVLEMVAGQTPLEPEMQAMIEQARGKNLHVALYPQTAIPAEDVTGWWQDARRDADWWTRWFEQYRRFALHYAAWAEQMNAEMLILGGPAVEPALPGYVFANNAEVGLPGDAAERWRALIEEVRGVYSGQVLWAVDYATGLKTAPEWIDAVDQIYLLWSAPLAKAEDATAKELTSQVTKLLKQSVLPLQKKYNKPILLGVAYPSANGALTGCVKIGETCATSVELSAPVTTLPANLEAQAAAYRALLGVVGREDHSWISGLFARGYSLPAAHVDASNSVRGKPVEALLAAWFEALR